MVNDRLTERERECLAWLARGERPKAIAHRLGLKRVTIDMHLRNARSKLSAQTREHAVAIAIQGNLIDMKE